MFNYFAKLTKVVDGDTVDLSVDLGFSVHVEERFRLYGINAPESRTSDPAEKAKGIAAKEFLIALLTTATRPLEVTTFKDDKEKYGRYLADIKVDGRSVSAIMISNGHAKEYFGGKRE